MWEIGASLPTVMRLDEGQCLVYIYVQLDILAIYVGMVYLLFAAAQVYKLIKETLFPSAPISIH